MDTDTSQKPIDTPLNCGSHDFDGMNLSYLDSGGEKPVLHFIQANGFPASAYLPKLIRLTDTFRVLSLGCTGKVYRPRKIYPGMTLPAI